MTISSSQCDVNGSSQYETGPSLWKPPGVAERPSKRDELRLSESWRKRVGVALREARSRADLTQPKLAELAGLDWTTISQIENGASAPDLATMEAIADALGVSLDLATGRASQARRDSAAAFFDELTPPAASASETGSRLPEDLRSLIEDIQGQAKAAMDAANNAQATADEAIRRLDARGDKSA